MPKDSLKAHGSEQFGEAILAPTVPEFAIVTDRAVSSEDRYLALFSSMEEGISTIEVIFDEGDRAVDFIFLENNPASRETAPLVGKRVKEVIPDVNPFWLETYGRVAKSGASTRFELNSKNGDAWFEFFVARMGGEGSHKIVVVTCNITGRKCREANLAFVAEINQDLAHFSERKGTMDALGAKIGKHFGVSRCLFVEIFESENKAAIILDWHLPGLSSLAGEFRISHFVSKQFRKKSRAGEVIVVSDVHQGEPLVDGRQVEFMFGIVSYVSVPVLREGAWKFTIAIYDSVKRDWREDETKLLRELTERIALVLEDDTERSLVLALQTCQRRTLELVAQGGSLEQVVELLTETIEDNSGRRLVGSVALLDETESRFVKSFGSGLPESYHQIVEGMLVSSLTGSCCYAVTQRELIVIDDVTVDPKWSGFASYIVPLGFLAAWSTPIIANDGKTLGTFAFYGKTPFPPTPRDIAFVEGITLTAALAIERVRSEKRLRESEARFRMIADNIDQLAWTCDHLGNVTWYNRRWLEYTGLSFEEMQGSGWAKVQHPDHLDRVVSGVRQAAELGERWEDTFPIRGSDGQYRWFLSRALPIRDDQGRIVCWFGTNTDVTAELSVQDALRQSEKRVLDLNEGLERNVALRTAELLEANEQLQGFTYSVAHDLRQQIRGISTNASIVLKDAPDSLTEENRRSLSRMVGSSLRLSTLVDQLLTYARLGRQRPELEVLNLTALAEQAHFHVSESCSFQPPRFDIARNLSALGDSFMLAIVLENLFDNACKYSRGREKPFVEFGATDTAFFVRDNGIGFDMIYADKVFQPFERLHSETQYSGTGIGLANVKRIIERLGGAVWVEAQPDVGATFYFTLPKAN